MSIRTVNKKNDGDKMEMVNKVESLIFKQALNYPLIQLIKNKTVIVNDHCTVENFTENCRSNRSIAFISPMAPI